MKSSFFVLVAEGKHKEALSSLGELKTIDFEGLNLSGRPYMVIKIAQSQIWIRPSSAKTGKWDIVLLLPNFQDSEASLERFRMINKYSRVNAKTSDMAGPFDLETLDKAFPELPFEILHNEKGELRIPHVFAGDQPEEMAKLAYVPTEKDCDDNVKSVEAVVWAKILSVAPVEEEPKEIIPKGDKIIIK